MQSPLVISLPTGSTLNILTPASSPSRRTTASPGSSRTYSINAQTRHEENGGDYSNGISGNGTVG
ncbi:hypothetical protein ACLBOM_13635 [Escherichia coli]